MGREQCLKEDRGASEVGEIQEHVAGEPSGKLLQEELSALSPALRNSQGSPENGLLDLVARRSCASSMTFSGVASIM